MTLDNWFLSSGYLYGKVAGKPIKRVLSPPDVERGSIVNGYTLGEPSTIQIKRVPYGD
jgi:hypothetical protein